MNLSIPLPPYACLQKDVRWLFHLFRTFCRHCQIPFHQMLRQIEVAIPRTIREQGPAIVLCRFLYTCHARLVVTTLNHHISTFFAKPIHKACGDSFSKVNHISVKRYNPSTLVVVVSTNMMKLSADNQVSKQECGDLSDTMMCCRRLHKKVCRSISTMLVGAEGEGLDSSDSKFCSDQDPSSVELGTTDSGLSTTGEGEPPFGSSS